MRLRPERVTPGSLVKRSSGVAELGNRRGADGGQSAEKAALAPALGCLHRQAPGALPASRCSH